MGWIIPVNDIQDTLFGDGIGIPWQHIEKGACMCNAIWLKKGSPLKQLGHLINELKGMQRSLGYVKGYGSVDACLSTYLNESLSGKQLLDGVICNLLSRTHSKSQRICRGVVWNEHLQPSKA